MVCNALVAGGRLLGVEQQAMRPGWGNLCNFCSTPNSRLPATKALHTICGNNTSIVSSSWWWAYECPKYVEQIKSAIKHSVASSWFSSLRLYEMTSSVMLFDMRYTYSVEGRIWQAYKWNVLGLQKSHEWTQRRPPRLWLSNWSTWKAETSDALGIGGTTIRVWLEEAASLTTTLMVTMLMQTMTLITTMI